MSLQFVEPHVLWGQHLPVCETKPCAGCYPADEKSPESALLTVAMKSYHEAYWGKDGLTAGEPGEAPELEQYKRRIRMLEYEVRVLRNDDPHDVKLASEASREAERHAWELFAAAFCQCYEPEMDAAIGKAADQMLKQWKIRWGSK